MNDLAICRGLITLLSTVVLRPPNNDDSTRSRSWACSARTPDESMVPLLHMNYKNKP